MMRGALAIIILPLGGATLVGATLVGATLGAPLVGATLGAPLVGATHGSPQPGVATRDSTPLAPLEPLVGRWGIPEGDSILVTRPELRTLIVAENVWGAQGRVLHHRENFQPADPAGAQLDGVIFWDPAQERIRFVAGTSSGGVFDGEYHALADGRISRVYDVRYPSTAAAPDDGLSGRRRRFREVYTPVGTDSIFATLERWRDGAWEAFRQGSYGLRRIAP